MLVAVWFSTPLAASWRAPVLKLITVSIALGKFIARPADAG